MIKRYFVVLNRKEREVNTILGLVFSLVLDVIIRTN